MLSLNEKIDWLAKANSIYCQVHVLRHEDGDFLRNALRLEVEGAKRDLEELVRG